MLHEYDEIFFGVTFEVVIPSTFENFEVYNV